MIVNSYSISWHISIPFSESTLLRLDASEYNPSTKLVHVMLLQVLKLCRVAVDSSSFSSALLRLVASIHLEVILAHK